METINLLQEQLDSLKVDFQKFEGGNKAAGTRVRVTAQNMKHDLQHLRQQVQAKKAEKS